VVRGGRFVTGFQGEQFALPEAVESLRAARRQNRQQGAITVAAADPMNLVGIVVPGERPTAIAGRTALFTDGVFEPAIEVNDPTLALHPSTQGPRADLGALQWGPRSMLFPAAPELTPEVNGD
jgi:ATP-dependent Lhr-like helicase